MNLEERFQSSTYNRAGSAYAGKTQFNKDTSDLNVDKVPSRYNVKGTFANGKDQSKLNIDQLPSKYSPK